MLIFVEAVDSVKSFILIPLYYSDFMQKLEGIPNTNEKIIIKIEAYTPKLFYLHRERLFVTFLSKLSCFIL